MKKRKIIISITIIIAILIIVGIEIYINLIKLPTKLLTEEEIKILLEKLDKNYDNYSIITTYYDEIHVGEEFYRKGERALEIYKMKDQTIRIWTDYNSNEMIVLQEEGKTYYISKVEKTTNETEKFGKLECMGYELYNGYRCAIIKAIDSGEYSNYEGMMWVDLNTGAILKMIDKNIYADGTISENTCYNEIKFKNVTDADVERPNLEGYTLYERGSE